MNLAKHDANTEMELNMTSMIDVVFLLIIFFMIITDLSQQDLEDLQLPKAHAAVEDKPDPNEKRPIVNIRHNGEIIVRRDMLFDPERDGASADPLKKLKQLLALVALNSPKAADGYPDDPLMIRGDISVPFKYVQKVMEACSLPGIQIWKVQLGASIPEEN
ncbi:MAG: biopolymer transporter ExbD [Planctomycetes bacterium]|nr:biopolymer transporter ExbD [Planctomycetota bacterium]MCB9910564.1 biopolymer transporter ExbD [Planctomycetota bacterium]MCB9913221.1 biopolymer transporter ExbD [Planctomycetota bacterium]